MIILMKLFPNSKLELIWTVKFVKQLFRIQKGWKVLLWNQVKSRIEACYFETGFRWDLSYSLITLVDSTIRVDPMPNVRLEGKPIL